MASVKLKTADAFALANAVRACAVTLGDWRIANHRRLRAPQWDALDAGEIALLNAASDLYTSAIGLVLTESTPTLAELQTCLRGAQRASRRLQGFRRALALLSSLLQLAAAIAAGQVAGIAAAVEAVGAASLG
jgi:hypothetical protein